MIKEHGRMITIKFLKIWACENNYCCIVESYNIKIFPIGSDVLYYIITMLKDV